MTALLHTHDLLSASRIAAAAQASGARLVSCANRDELLRLASGSDVQLILLDLSLPGLALADLVPQLRAARAKPLSIVAYGPHVDAAGLAEARQVGCDRVMARGQFLAQVTTMFAPDGGRTDSANER